MLANEPVLEIKGKSPARKVSRKKAPAKKAPVSNPVVNNFEKAEEIAKEVKSTPNGYIVADGGDYVCVKKCTFGKAMYPVGRLYISNKGDLIPHHFQKVESLDQD